MGRLPEPFAGKLSRKRVGLQKLWGLPLLNGVEGKKLNMILVVIDFINNCGKLVLNGL